MFTSSEKPSLTSQAPGLQLESTASSFGSPALFYLLFPNCQLHIYLPPPRPKGQKIQEEIWVGEDGRQW